MKTDLVLNNNYPAKFINKQIQNYYKKKKYPKPESTEFDFEKSFVIPSRGKITKKLKYTLKKIFNINTILYTYPYKLNSFIKLGKNYKTIKI